MCMACEEMQLFYAYLDAVEEAKRKAQPWQCEVTVFSEEGGSITLPAPTPASRPRRMRGVRSGRFAVTGCPRPSGPVASVDEFEHQNRLGDGEGRVAGGRKPGGAEGDVHVDVVTGP